VILERYLNKIYNIIERIPQEELIKKASKRPFSSGDLLFNKSGQSVEFNQYNNYTDGDTIKHVDWKQYAKTEKLYTKKFHSESNSNILFLLDTTKSMDFKELAEVSKLEYSTLLFGVLSYILLSAKSGISVLSNNYLGFKKQFSEFPMLLNSIEKEKEFNVVDKLLKIQEIKETKNSTIFIISDFMYEVDDLLKEVKRMKILNYDFYFIQVLTKQELEFNYKGVVKFKDMETNENIITEPLSIKKLYLEELKIHNDKISNTLFQNNMKYKLIDTSINIELNILNLFGI
jgi:uncharacterized protein (DUF58 family)